MTILEELQLHNKREQASFHMPGHKKGAGFCAGVFKEDVFALDTTELCDTDALIEPTGSILEAEKRAAACYGAGHSFYLVNGSTGGILSMFYASFKPGDVVLIDRNCHRSVIHAAALTGIVPVYMTPGMSRLEVIPGAVSAELVATQLKKYPEARGVFVTSPNYYGAAADLRAIADLTHEHGAVLLVDEAHGAHFPFSEAFPPTAMEQGADLSVVSLHKTLSAPNQTALLHMARGGETERIREAVRTFQTSSPSFVFLAAMEQAVLQAEKVGAQETDRVLAELGEIPWLDDPFKRILSYRHRGYSGYEVDEILRHEFGIYAELCDPQLVLLMPSWANSCADFALLREAVGYLDALPEKKGEIILEADALPASTEVVLSPLELRQKETEPVVLRAAGGRICAAAVSAFPPCIPIILPGERITLEQVLLLEGLQKQGARLTGLLGENQSILCVR